MLPGLWPPRAEQAAAALGLRGAWVCPRDQRVLRPRPPSPCSSPAPRHSGGAAPASPHTQPPGQTCSRPRSSSLGLPWPPPRHPHPRGPPCPWGWPSCPLTPSSGGTSTLSGWHSSTHPGTGIWASLPGVPHTAPETRGAETAEWMCPGLGGWRPRPRCGQGQRLLRPGGRAPSGLSPWLMDDYLPSPSVSPPHLPFMPVSLCPGLSYNDTGPTAFGPTP